MRLNNGCFVVFFLFFVIYRVDSRPQFFLDKIGDTLKQTGCKVQEIGSKVFSHKQNGGSSSCTDKNNGEKNSNDPFINNSEQKPSTGYAINQNSNQPSDVQNHRNQVGYEPNNQQYPTHVENDVQPTRSSTNRPNTMVFPGEAEKPKPSTYNSQQGLDGRTLANKPNQQMEPVGENPSHVRGSNVAVSSSTTARSHSRKTYLDHSSKRKQYSSDYSDEDSDDGTSKKKKKKIPATPPPDSNEDGEGVTDGRSLIGKVKTNCPEGYVADKRGRCREVYG
ncbi:putative uncharacterized protein DDB_G0282133 [Diorhabda sublineata]|uniref:putative uncharacterized protein DDB_G0282133 n=1 Tax=Diorhabda sublineata TaxID=1163346 RepID=UPI0024E09FD3|nr:putative uncharacterized protein DDB_G0282133 [Diorhabda sublineata]